MGRAPRHRIITIEDQRTPAALTDRQNRRVAHRDVRHPLRSLRELFQTARDVYLALKKEPLQSMRTWYSGRVSAELAMSIATAKCTFSLYSESHVPVTNNAMVPLDTMASACLGLTFCVTPPDAAWQARYDAILRSVTPTGVEPLFWGRIDNSA